MTNEGICYDVVSLDSLLKPKWDPVEHLMGLRSRISVMIGLPIPRDCEKNVISHIKTDKNYLNDTRRNRKFHQL